MQKYEQNLINWVSTLVQKFDPKATTIPHWAALALVAITTVFSIPFDSKTILELIAGGLAVVGLPVFAIAFHKAGTTQAKTVVAVPAVITASAPLQVTVKAESRMMAKPASDGLDKLYVPIKESAISGALPSSGIIEPTTATATEGPTPDMADLSTSETTLLALLVQAGKDNSSALVSAVNAKGVTADNLMAQAAAKLIAKYPTLGNYEGAEATLAADMVSKAGGPAAAIALANEILVTEEFGTVAAPPTPITAPATPAPAEKAVAAPETPYDNVAAVLGTPGLAPIAPAS